MKEVNETTQIIIGIAYKIHTQLGPGLLESVYKECLFYELNFTGIGLKKECPIPLIYKEIKMAIGFRADLIVADRVIVEIKSVEEVSDVHKAQVLTYLKLTKLRVGLLLNFNVSDMKTGITRLIL